MIICSSSGAGITVKCRYYKRVEEQGVGEWGGPQAPLWNRPSLCFTIQHCFRGRKELDLVTRVAGPSMQRVVCMMLKPIPLFFFFFLAGPKRFPD